MDLHWLHQFVDIDCKTQHGKTVSYEIEEFGTYYDGGDAQQQEVLVDVDKFLDNHSSMNLDFMEFLSVQVIHPIEYTLRHGVEDIEKSAEITRLRKVSYCNTSKRLKNSALNFKCSCSDSVISCSDSFLSRKKQYSSLHISFHEFIITITL